MFTELRINLVQEKTQEYSYRSLPLQPNMEKPGPLKSRPCDFTLVCEICHKCQIRPRLARYAASHEVEGAETCGGVVNQISQQGGKSHWFARKDRWLSVVWKTRCSLNALRDISLCVLSLSTLLRKHTPHMHWHETFTSGLTVTVTATLRVVVTKTDEQSVKCTLLAAPGCYEVFKVVIFSNTGPSFWLIFVESLKGVKYNVKLFSSEIVLIWL